MKKIIHNDDNLREEEITEEVIRCKALIINSDNQLLIANENNVFHFPGGHLEENEKLIDCLIREVNEETGINLDNNEINIPFMKVEFLNRDYPSKGINRKNSIYYYVVNTDKDIDLTKTKYTDNERNKNFKIEKINILDSIRIIEDNIKNDPKNEVIAPDMIIAINEYLYGEKEELDIYDKDGNPTGKTFKRGGEKVIFSDNEYIGLCIIFIENTNGEFLIQYASKEKLNKISSTGGHINRGESPIDCIIRETKEEIGLDLTKDELTCFNKIYQNNKLIYPFYIKKDIDINNLTLQKEEVEYVKYISKNELEKLIDSGNFSVTHSFVYNEVIRR